MDRQISIITVKAVQFIKELLLFWLLALNFTIDAIAHDWHQANYIVDSFVEIALKNEYTTTGQMVRKWPAKGISYYYVHQVLDDRLHEQLTDRHLQHLRNITGLPINPVSSLKDANLTIVFSREDSLKVDLQQFFGIQSGQERDYFFRHSVCMGHFSTRAEGAIDKAVVIIPVDRARSRAKLVDCIVEELTQVMGLPNDSDKVFPSIFNDHSIDHLLTGLDYVLLKILYDQRLRAGMDKVTALPVVQAIVADLMKTGLIAQADQQVLKGSLYSLLNAP